MRPSHTTLQPPHRLDLRAADLARGVATLLTVDERRARAALEAGWHADGLAFLSVRSALCAFLEAQRASGAWQPGDEVLVSALTIQDMPKLIEAHGFVPVAVEVDAHGMAPRLDDLQRKCNARTRAVLVAHLFGARVELAEVARFCRQHGLLLLEDCAQAFVGPGFVGHPEADLAMFSFGTLKTCTALGGALARVRDPALRARMAEIQTCWPRQRTGAFVAKLARAAAFLVAQHPLVYGLLAHAIALGGESIGAVLRRATRGFPAGDVVELLSLLRKRPCAALLAFLRVRLAHVDAERLVRRAAVGEELAARADGHVPGAGARYRTHWIFPIETTSPARLREALWRIGIDASGASNIAAVGGVAARALVQSLVFVPAYPELSPAARAALAEAVQAHLRRDVLTLELPPGTPAPLARSAAC
ncbi:MAG: DegT/DnrJ/EryC1/StrS family aminotransferase [Deltaproteobacteria bacterium]|nr:DegT/DnrJ/EryC1/StrS family aminotransferase [Deltaproteobacteria bacterium]